MAELRFTGFFIDIYIIEFRIWYTELVLRFPPRIMILMICLMKCIIGFYIDFCDHIYIDLSFFYRNGKALLSFSYSLRLRVAYQSYNQVSNHHSNRSTIVPSDRGVKKTNVCQGKVINIVYFKTSYFVCIRYNIIVSLRNLNEIKKANAQTHVTKCQTYHILVYS